MGSSHHSVATSWFHHWSQSKARMSLDKEMIFNNSLQREYPMYLIQYSRCCLSVHPWNLIFCTFCKSCTCFETLLEHGPSQMLSYGHVHCPLQCRPARASLALSLVPNWIGLCCFIMRMEAWQLSWLILHGFHILYFDPNSCLLDLACKFRS